MAFIKTAGGSVELSSSKESKWGQVSEFVMIWHLTCVANIISKSVSRPSDRMLRQSSRYDVHRRGSVFLYAVQVLTVSI